MANYYLRDKNGILKAKFSSTIARKVIDNADGFFREAKYADSNVTVFEIRDGSKLSLMGLDVFFWEGDILVPTNGSGV